jgi:S-adenosylmethionine hydrolase
MLPITLTTDFGTASPYVSAMKGVMLSVNPAAHIHDLTHSIPPQDLRHAAHFLAGSVPYFPPGTVHVCVVDPGVGSERAILLVEIRAQLVLVPDNGCVTELLAVMRGEPIVRCVEEPKYWRPTISSTFHGRDIFAPVAAHLSLGVPAEEIGPTTTNWVKLRSLEAKKGNNQIVGEVSFIDEFGNLITNIPADSFPCRPGGLKIGKEWRSRLMWVKTYSDAAPGTIVALPSSNGRLEIAVSQGNAAKILRATVGACVTIVIPGE